MFGKKFLLQLQDLISKPDHVHFANFEDSFLKMTVMLYGKETDPWCLQSPLDNLSCQLKN